MIQLLIWLSLIFAARAVLGFVLNLAGFIRSAPVNQASPPTAVSVLIPARNEAAGIRKTLLSVLANPGVELEVLVLDDQSTDEPTTIAWD